MPADICDGQEQAVFSVDPKTGERFGPGYRAASGRDVERICKVAAAAFDTYRETRLEHRSTFLERIAEEILATGDALVETAVRETALPRARIEGERGRTVTQLRFFAEVVREGRWLGLRIDSAQPEREPTPRPDLRLRHLPLGPVAVFGASNFPLAFSVAGGDSASALAAGCPIIVKAHPAHPATSQLVADAISRAVEACGMPAGTFGMIHSADNVVSGALVSDPRIKAVGFTGSRSGGLALMALAAKRPDPIPVFAEMSSINPVIVLPEAVAARGERIAENYVASLTLGVGQFCTNPGLMMVLRGPTTEAFLKSVGAAVARARAGTMLSAQIHGSFTKRQTAIEAAGIHLVGRGYEGEGPFDAAASVFATSAARFIGDGELTDEIFGPTGLIVQCETVGELVSVLEHLEGQLTIALHMAPADYPLAKELLPLLERRAGRILANGFGTGVEVTHAMVHGGPFPATSDGRSTSVGSLAIHRFLRPLCYQDLPPEVLPTTLRDENPDRLPRLIDGSMS